MRRFEVKRNFKMCFDFDLNVFRREGDFYLNHLTLTEFDFISK